MFGLTLSRLVPVLAVSTFLIGCALPPGRPLPDQALTRQTGSGDPNDPYANASIEALIDALVLIAAPAPGINGMAWYDGFIADDQPLSFMGGLLGVPPPTIPPQMRELVRRGRSAVPTLLRHLQDERRTGLAVGGLMFLRQGPFWWQAYSDEYEPRDPRIGRPSHCPNEGCATRDFERHTVRVGDVCYVLLGQIINRRLDAVRYQPSGGLIVNSPIEMPSLAERAQSDWGNLDAQAHLQGLLQDLRRADHLLYFGPALARLRLYYPEAYQALSGDDLRKRDLFEAEARRENGRKAHG